LRRTGALCPPLKQSPDATVAYGLAARPDGCPPALSALYLDWLDSELDAGSHNDERQGHVRERLELVGDTARFREHIVAEIRAGRTVLGLNENTDLRI
jgi:hypothetical protein